MRISLGRLTILVAVVIPSALLLVAGSIEMIGSRAILPAFRFVLPNATAYLATGPLRDLWANAPSHISRVFSQAASEKGKVLASKIKGFLTDRCIATDELANLAQLGIDDTRGAAITMVDSQRYLFAVPISNPERFASLLTRVTDYKFITLGHKESENQAPHRKIKAIRIDDSTSSGVVICGADKKLITLTEGMLVPIATARTSSDQNKESDQEDKSNQDETAGFSIGLRSGETAKIMIHCTTIFADGTIGSCYCDVSDNIDSRHHDDCSTQTQTLQPTLNNLVHSDIVTLNLGTIPLSFSLKENVALIAIGLDNDLLIKAGRRAGDNLGYFSNDDSFLETFSHLSKIVERENGVIFGAVNVPSLPITGRTHFALDIGPHQLTARALLPWQTLQSTLLESLATPTRLPSEMDDKLLSTDAEVQVNDPRLGYYLGFIDSHGKASEFYLKRFGSFLGFFRDVANMKKTGAFRLAVRGIHDGVPNLVMSLEMSRIEAESLLMNQRVRMREVRDREILWAAAQKYIHANYGKPPTAIDQLKPYLYDELGAVWDHYLISSEATWDDRTSMQTAFDVSANLNNERFLVGYQMVRDHIEIQYIAPAVTANDLAYRVPAGSDKVDTAALQSDRFRLAAFVDEQNNRLLVGTDADVLVEVLKSKSSPIDSNNPPSREPSKFRLLGDPKYLINQGRLDPDKEINRIVSEYLLDLEQYRTLNARVEPLATHQAISATVVLSHE
jgi:hypothetical protein